MSLADVAKRYLETRTDLIIPVDHTSGKDPPTNVVFPSQAAVDGWLADQSVSAMKTLEGAWYSVPNYIRHAVTFQLVSGVHRPLQAGEQGGFMLDGKTMSTDGADVTIEGVAPASWTVEEASETISSYSNTGDNPYMDFPTSTYPNDGSLKGLFAVLDTGQVTIVHDHSDSRLEVMHQLSPAPTSVTIMRPSTVLQNSLDGAARAGTIAGVYARNHGIRNLARIHFKNILMEAFGSTYAALGDGQPTDYTQCMVDIPREFASHGLTSSDDSGGIGGFGEYCSIWTCSCLGPKFGGRTPTGAAILARKNGYVTGSFFNGFDVGNTTSRELRLQTTSVVFENFESHALLVDGGGSYEPQETMSHRRTTIRNGPGVSIGGASNFDASASVKMWFEGVTTACIRVGDRCQFYNDDASLDLANGPLGGNTDVGFEFRSYAVRAAICLNGTVTVNGTVGDVRDADGTLVSYASLTSPHTDGRDNIIVKD